MGCSSTQHNQFERSTKCQAWGQECKNCGILNHYARVCLRHNDRLKVNSINLVAHVKYNTTLATYTPTSNHNLEEIYATLVARISNQKNSKQANMLIFPDSGASICLAGPQHLIPLGIDMNDLIPCNKSVTAVGGSILKCRGWLPVKFDVDGHKTLQPLYICEKIDRIYFSKTACIDVSIIHDSFPHPIKGNPISSIVSFNNIE